MTEVITWEEQDEFIQQELRVTKEQRQKIMELPQRSKAWLRARQGRLTGSVMAAAIGHNFFCRHDDLLIQLLWSTFKGNEATAYGTKMEPVAFQVYNDYLHEQKQDLAQEMGLYIHLDKPWFAYSPDGVRLKGLLEIKCPFKKKLYGRIPQMYYDQISYGMWILQKQFCDFVCFTPTQTSIETYTYEEEYTEDMLLVRAEDFYFRKYLPRFLGKRRGLIQEDTCDWNTVVHVERYRPLPFKEYVD
jgi:putative phage-type endonuclease